MRRTVHVSLLAALVLLVLSGVVGTASPGAWLISAAQMRPLDAGPRVEGAPFTLTGYRWVDEPVVEVYSHWGGGDCMIDGADLSGPASPFVAEEITAALLDASIEDINAQLQGGLTLVNAGPATRAALCDKSSARPIIVGWGTIPETGRTLSYGYGSSQQPGEYSFEFARVYLTNAYDFACGGSPEYRDLQHTITHELLHALGVGHSDDPTAVMVAVSVACQADWLLQDDDVEALHTLYPPPASEPEPTPSPTPSPTPTGTPDPGSTVGAFTAVPTFSDDGQALAVFDGETVEDLYRSTETVEAAGVWVQDASGAFRLLVVGGPAFLRADFESQFPSGFGNAVAVTLIR